MVLRTARLDFHFMLMFANYMTGTPSVPTVTGVSPISHLPISTQNSTCSSGGIVVAVVVVVVVMVVVVVVVVEYDTSVILQL